MDSVVMEFICEGDCDDFRFYIPTEQLEEQEIVCPQCGEEQVADAGLYELAKVKIRKAYK